MGDIPQYQYSGEIRQARERTLTCPSCGYTKSAGFAYGTVDTPPIAIQLEDNRRGVTREWQAARCHCSCCNHLWDVVTVNKPEKSS